MDRSTKPHPNGMRGNELEYKYSLVKTDHSMDRSTQKNESEIMDQLWIKTNFYACILDQYRVRMKNRIAARSLVSCMQNDELIQFVKQQIPGIVDRYLEIVNDIGTEAGVHTRIIPFCDRFVA
eukprot:1076096_1